jgi:hypothetical protein
VSPTPPPTTSSSTPTPTALSCATADEYRFDLVASNNIVPESISICGFYVVLKPTSPGTSMLARGMSLSGDRATRFGVKPIGAGADVLPGLYDENGVQFSFEDRDESTAVPINANIAQVEVSHLGEDTLIGKLFFFFFC